MWHQQFYVGMDSETFEEIYSEMLQQSEFLIMKQGVRNMLKDYGKSVERKTLLKKIKQ